MKRILYIDGSNLYAGQFDLFGPEKYLKGNIFIKEIEKQLGILWDSIYIYASYSPISKKPTAKEKLRLKNEGLFFKSIRRITNSIFFKGYRSPTSGKEKEVDVKLAVDIVDMLHRNKFDELYLLSGDADFMHALQIVQNKNKPITIICLENRIPFRLLYFFKTVIIGKQKSISTALKLRKTVTVKYIDIDYSILTARI